MTHRTDYDTAWKDILDVFIREFLTLCHPSAAAEIDWSKGYELLDKELSAISRDSETGKRFVDKLIKVWRKDGKEAWVLIHIEVQGEPEDDFEQRMFTYHYRLYDRYKIPIMSLAILTDRSSSWRPSFYEHSIWGCHLRFDFVSIKLLDFKEKYSWRIEDSNPFWDIILLYLSILRAKKDDKARLQHKYFLTHRLYRRGWDKEIFLKLYKFMDWLLTLPEPLEIEYLNKLEQYEERKNMSYITSAERIGMKRGIEQGMKQGIEQGIEQGMQNGIRKGLLEGEKSILLHLLQSKFGILPFDYKARIEKANTQALIQWAEKLLWAKTLYEVFNFEIENVA